MRIAFLGLGRMGIPMARNLARSDHELIVWNRTREKTTWVEGAVAAGSPSEAAAGADLVITMLSDDEAVGSVVLGKDGVLGGMAAGRAHASMSTISPELSRRLAEAHRERSQGYVAAPVFGRPDMAENAALRIVAAGAKEAMSLCRPAFEVLGQGIIEAGSDPAHANVMKLAGNLMLASAIEAMAEAYALVGAHGLSVDLFHETMAKGLFRSPIYEAYGDMIRTHSYEPAGFTLHHGLKDIRFALGAGEEVAVPMPFASVLRDQLLSAAARGWESADWAALGRVVSVAAGLEGAEGEG